MSALLKTSASEREMRRRWCEANPEKTRESKRRWREANRDKIRESDKRYQVANRDEIRAKRKRYYEANREKLKEGRKRWRAANPDVVREQWRRRRARVLRAPTAPISIVRARATSIKGTPCLYCGEMGSTVDHVVPLSRAGAHTPENLISACSRCNKSKCDRPLGVFLAAQPTPDWQVYATHMAAAASMGVGSGH